MKKIIIIAALLLAGCTEYRCINGHIYRKIDRETWVPHNRHYNDCVTGATNDTR
jgi:hypothetical protein